jgi:hypothetical protein
LVANVGLVNIFRLGKGDLEHSHYSGVLEVIQTFKERLKLIDNGDVGDLVDLVETFNSVLYELSKVNSGLNCV